MHHRSREGPASPAQKGAACVSEIFRLFYFPVFISFRFFPIPVETGGDEFPQPYGVMHVASTNPATRVRLSGWGTSGRARRALPKVGRDSSLSRTRFFTLASETRRAETCDIDSVSVSLAYQPSGFAPHLDALSRKSDGDFAGGASHSGC